MVRFRGKQRQRQRIQHLALEPLETRAMLSISATIDYSFDTNNFFNTTAKRDVLQLAADEIVARFDDDLSAISPSGSNTWSASFFHPATGLSHNVSNLNVDADEIIIYAGGRNLGGTLGQGGPGGYSVSGSSSWISTIQYRGESAASGSSPTDFGPWGGSVAFNSTETWHFGETTSGLNSGEFDFYSVALHELAHLFGFGTSDSFDTFTSGTSFTGPESVAAYDLPGNVPLDGGLGHWASGTLDGGTETGLDPSIASGTRKELTVLDLAGLDDIGWEIDLSEPAQSKLNASEIAASDWFGYTVDIDGNYAVVGAPLQDDGGSAAGAAYIFEFDGVGWVEQTVLVANDAAAVDQFGWSVGIDGDTVVVGAHLEDSTSGQNGGSAYVFERDFGGTDNWGQVAKVIGSGTTRGDKFGFAVDISGDTIVVGAQHDDPAGSASGAAYVFDRDEGGTNSWGEVAALSGSGASASDLFGYSVSIDGDVIVVGSRFGDTGVTNSGSAQIFERNDGGTNNWGEVATIGASDASTDQFGYSVAISGDTVAVGSRLDDDGGSNTGSVYLYDRDEGGTDNWGEVTKVTASDRTAGAWFGNAVDLDGDELVVGALFAKTSGVKVGGAYHLSRDQGGADNWGEIAKIIADDAANNDRFGVDVAISGTRIASGAYLEDPGATSAGSVYVSLINPGSSSGGHALVAEPITESNIAVKSFDFGTARKDPGGCGCGGAGCAACAPREEYGDVTSFETRLNRIDSASLEASRESFDSPRQQATDTAFAQLPKRIKKTNSRFFSTNRKDDLSDSADWLDESLDLLL